MLNFCLGCWRSRVRSPSEMAGILFSRESSSDKFSCSLGMGTERPCALSGMLKIPWQLQIVKKTKPDDNYPSKTLGKIYPGDRDCPRRFECLYWLRHQFWGVGIGGWVGIGMFCLRWSLFLKINKHTLKTLTFAWPHLQGSLQTDLTYPVSSSLLSCRPVGQ